MNTVNGPPRRERDLKWYLNITVSNLGSCYMHLKPGAGSEDFAHEILRVVAKNDDPSIEEPIEIVMSCVSDEDRAKGPDWIARSPYGSIIVATAYYFRVHRAMRAGDIGLAWSFMADARYWAGVALSSKGIGEARENTIITVKRERGVVGAVGKDKTYEPIRQFAYKIVVKRQPPQKGWQSRNHAVKTIKDVVLRFAMRKGVQMSGDQAGKTIDGWLAKMPEAAALFPRKKNSQRKKGSTTGAQ
ncbi:hypothetical protein [Burkholderia pseudomallei]|uniref:hypothetical protein n=1 Tax=Burkholderia pseudomallei TaxID=28450 RepID=UPI0021F764FD|nr:hypothetical protein [Burkholderia pseudomallei]MCW0022742.1 hypothetical protein [Burkholderia pseudomallei]MCW0168366.1 hypothetical protein [Burkholderia pseudomallei]